MKKKNQWSNDYFHMDVNYMFNQMYAREGINIFVESEVYGKLKEYTWLYHTGVLSQLKVDKILREEKKQALHVITLMK